MSTGLECVVVEARPGCWYYVLQDWTCPRGAWDWREYSNATGPFAGDEAALAHLLRHHANPGGYDVVRHSPDVEAQWARFVQEARRP